MSGLIPGSDTPINKLFQDGTDPVYKGKENRAPTRKNLIPELQDLADILIARIKHNDRCFLSESAQEAVSQGISALSDIGDGKPLHGVDKARDQHKRVEGGLSFWDIVKKRAALTAIGAAVLAVMGLVYKGFISG